MKMRSPPFSPEIERALRVDVSAVLLFTVFASLTTPFIGLILRRELGATPLQLSVMSAAGGACLLLSLAWARALCGHAPLPYLVWPSFVARGLFLLVPLASWGWLFVSLVVATNVFGAAAAPARAAVVERLYPRAGRGRVVALGGGGGGGWAGGLALAAVRLSGGGAPRVLLPAAAVLGMPASLRQRYLPVPAASEDGEGTVGGLREAWAAVRDDDVFRRLLVASFLFGTGCWIQTPAHPLLLVDVLHVSTAQVGVFAAAAAAATLVGGAWWGGLVDRRSSLDALWMMYLVGAATPAICALAWSPWVLVASSVTDALLGIGLELVWMMVVIDIAGPARAAQYVAIGATLAGVRGVLGPLAGGVAGCAGARAPRRCILPIMMKTMAAILLGFILVVGVSTPARAGAPTDQLREYSDQVTKVLDDPALKPRDRREAVRKIAKEIFDVAETAKRALARHWGARTPEEREEFTQLFADLLESTYIMRIDQYGGERIRYVSETVDGDNAIVRAKVVTKKGTEVPVESRLLHRGDRWLIYDVLIENVSLIANYRAQFDKIVRTTSYGELVRRLKNKRDEFLNESASSRRTSD